MYRQIVSPIIYRQFQISKTDIYRMRNGSLVNNHTSMTNLLISLVSLWTLAACNLRTNKGEARLKNFEYEYNQSGRSKE